jgi:uncharacterized membrane protein YvbJ
MKKISLLLLAFTLFFTTQCTPAADKEIETLTNKKLSISENFEKSSDKLTISIDKLIVIGDIVTWHLRQPSGGIRSNNSNQKMWEDDEKIFIRYIAFNPCFGRNFFRTGW